MAGAGGRDRRGGAAAAARDAGGSGIHTARRWSQRGAGRGRSRRARRTPRRTTSCSGWRATDLSRTSPSGAVTLDALANALKARGFSRPPGSPRLITRLRRLRELAVSRAGHITLVGRRASGRRSSGPSRRRPRSWPRCRCRRRSTGMTSPEKPIEPDEVDEVDGNRRVDRPLDERRAEVEAAQQRAREFQPPRTHQAAPAPTGGGERDDSQRRRRSRRGGRRHRRPSTSTAS